MVWSQWRRGVGNCATVPPLRGPALIKTERKKKPAHFGRDDRKAKTQKRKNAKTQKRPPRSAATTKSGALALLASRAEARPLQRTASCTPRYKRCGELP